MDLIRRFVAFLLGLVRPRPAPSPVVLARSSLESFTGVSNSTVPDVCAVTAYDAVDITPREGVAVRYEIVDGAARFADGSSSAVALTGPDGVAHVAVRLPGVGASIISASLDGDRDKPIGFAARSEGVTHEIRIDGPPSFSVVEGEARLAIRAWDHVGSPVIGAPLSIEASQPTDIRVLGEVTELGDGLYEGVFTTSRAGEWSVVVADDATHVFETRCIHAVPDGPNSIQLVGETDPREARPYESVTLRAQLVDRFGNPLDASRLSATAGGADVASSVFRDEARFPVSFPGYGLVDVVIVDGESAVSLELSVDFAAVALDRPGFVDIGDPYQTTVYAFPEPGRPTDHVTLTIEFDAELTRFSGFTPAADPPLPFEAFAEVREPGVVVVTVTGEREVTAEQYPNGIEIGSCSWDCLGEGTTCFSVVAAMSPSRKKVDYCVDQKKKITKNVCVRPILPPRDANAAAAGDAIVNNIRAVMTDMDNVEICCPVVTVTKDACTYTDADWNQVLAKTGADGKITTVAEFDAVVGLAACKKANCYNIRLIPFNDAKALGRTQRGRPGQGALDPGTATTRANVGMHEFGHALGLPDLYQLNADGTIDGGPAGNCMSFPHGDDFTRDQCATIFASIDSYSS